MTTIKLDKNFSDKCDELMKDLPRPTTQVEEIIWHKYPEEKPKELGFYLIQLGRESPSNLFDRDIWNGFHFVNAHSNSNIVFVWAELPKGWKEDYNK